ncbi:hypothetical protein H9P43_001064 [Blastocladiella emersonii ATCC 22665]|nr:hypothetical protein H9P43_001064 [Blastocladiella emersonii ATCC 22665]
MTTPFPSMAPARPRPDDSHAPSPAIAITVPSPTPPARTGSASSTSSNPGPAAAASSPSGESPPVARRKSFLQRLMNGPDHHHPHPHGTPAHQPHPQHQAQPSHLLHASAHGQPTSAVAVAVAGALAPSRVRSSSASSAGGGAASSSSPGPSPFPSPVASPAGLPAMERDNPLLLPPPAAHAGPGLPSSPSPPSNRRRQSFREVLSNGALRIARSLSPASRGSASAAGGSPPSPKLSGGHHGEGGGKSGSHHEGGGGVAASIASMLLGSDARGSPHPFTEKYGKCEKGCIGKGATAVVRIAHKPRGSPAPGAKSPSGHSLTGPTAVSSGASSAASSAEHLPLAGADAAAAAVAAAAGSATGKDGDQCYAIKEFRRRRKHESERDYIKKVTAEFCISSSLHHVNVVQTLDLIQDEHHHWCEVMEYCPGGDLFSVIQGGRMSTDEINCCFKQLLSGVEYLHQNGVAHRDLKPENLLLDESGRLKITDFGVSEVFKMCWESRPHLSEGICGSAPYIAPEVFTEPRYDARELDVWACGIIFYAMTYHGIPWRHATPDDPNYATYVGVWRSYEAKHAPPPDADGKPGLAPRPKGPMGYEAIDRLPGPCRELLYWILDPNPRRRATVQDVVQHPWFKSIRDCHEAASSAEESDVEADPATAVKEAKTRADKKHVHHTVLGIVRAPELPPSASRSLGRSSKPTTPPTENPPAVPGSGSAPPATPPASSDPAALASASPISPVGGALAAAGNKHAPLKDSGHSIDRIPPTPNGGDHDGGYFGVPIPTGGAASSVASSPGESPASSRAVSRASSRDDRDSLPRHSHSHSYGSSSSHHRSSVSSSSGASSSGASGGSNGPLTKIEAAVKNLLHHQH